MKTGCQSRIRLTSTGVLKERLAIISQSWLCPPTAESQVLLLCAPTLLAELERRRRTAILIDHNEATVRALQAAGYLGPSALTFLIPIFQSRRVSSIFV